MSRGIADTSLFTAAAARRGLETSGLPDELAITAITVGELRAALLCLDEARAEDVIDRLLASYALDTVLREAILPFLHDLGDLWSRGAITVGQEHFATAVITGTACHVFIDGKLIRQLTIDPTRRVQPLATTVRNDPRHP